MERQRMKIWILPRILEKSALGSLKERLAAEGKQLRGNVLPESAALGGDERGLKRNVKLRVLIPGEAEAETGDGARIGGRLYRIRSVERWSAHTELICEAVE